MGKNPGASNCRELLPPLGGRGMVADLRESNYLRRVAREHSQSTGTSQRVNQGLHFHSYLVIPFLVPLDSVLRSYCEQFLRQAVTFSEAGIFMHCSEPLPNTFLRTAVKPIEKAFVRVCYLPGPASDSVHTLMSNLKVPFGKFLSETCFKHAALL